MNHCRKFQIRLVTGEVLEKWGLLPVLFESLIFNEWACFKLYLTVPASIIRIDSVFTNLFFSFVGAQIESMRQDEVEAMRAKQKLGLRKLQSMFTEIFGLGRAAALSAVISILVVLVLGIFLFFYLAPPKTITMISGPEGSTFRRTA